MTMGDDGSPEAVARRLEAIRRCLSAEAGKEITKREFATRAGLTEQTYSGYTSCSRPLSLESARRLRMTYGLPLDFLFYGVTRDLPMRYAAAIPQGEDGPTPPLRKPAKTP